MIYVQHVKSTMKKGCDVELGPRTVIVGANGAGKSTIVQSAELATRGTVSDFEGRDQVKLHTSLARLFPTETMSVEVTLSNGMTCSWAMEPKKKGGFSRPDAKVPVGVRWPLQELHEVLTGSEDKVAGWLEAIVIGDLTETDILGPLAPEVRDDVRELMRGGLRDFMQLSKLAKDKARTLKSSATRAEKTIESMVQGVAPPMLPEERDKLQAELEALQPQPGLVSQEQYDAIEASIRSLVQQYTTVSNTIQQLPELDPQVRAAVQKVGAARNLIQQHVNTFGQGQGCWVCGSTNEVPNWQSEQLDQVAESLAPQLASAGERKRLQLQLQDVETRLRAEVARRDSVTGIGFDTTQGEREKILAKLAADDANQRTWRNAQSERASISQDRAKAARLTAASKALATAGKDLLRSKKGAFTQAVSAYLPDGDELGVDLDAGRVGLVRNGELHSALSGAEWTRVLLGLAAFWTAGSSTPCVLMPQDRAWDRDTLTSVMEALSGAPVQVIIMSTVSPEHVEGWTIVNV